MASAGTRAAAAALLFSFSAVLFLLLIFRAPAPCLDLVVSALDRFLDRRGGLLELATRRNMILLCHAILLVILRDAGVLGTPSSSRRSRSPPQGEATSAAAVAVAETAIVVAQTAVPVPARPHATRSAVVWRRRRPRNRTAAPVNDAAARRLVECPPAAEAVATRAAPVLTTGAPAQAEEAAASKQIVLVESPRNDDDDLLDHHDQYGRDAVVEPLEHPTAIAERDDSDDRRIVAVAADDDEKRSMDDQTAGTEKEMELADDRTFEEFIESQRRQMRQESLQLLSSGYRHHYQYQAIAS